jgi:hypothetical protein
VIAAVAKEDAEVFAFSTHDAFDGIPEDLGATRITTDQLANFMSQRPRSFLPESRAGSTRSHAVALEPDPGSTETPKPFGARFGAAHSFLTTKTA